MYVRIKSNTSDVQKSNNGSCSTSSKEYLYKNLNNINNSHLSHANNCPQHSIHHKHQIHYNHHHHKNSTSLKTNVALLRSAK